MRKCEVSVWDLTPRHVRCKDAVRVCEPTMSPAVMGIGCFPLRMAEKTPSTMMPQKVAASP